MKEIRINKNVVKRISENGDINFFKKIDYDMNVYYTKLSENIFDQMGVKYSKSTEYQEGSNRYLVTKDIQEDKELFLGKDITDNTELALIKNDFRNFLENKQINNENIKELWDDFLKMILADIYTSNPDRHGKNWGILIKDNIAQIAPNFDFDYTFSQNEYAMKNIAQAVENKENKVANKVMKNYNIKKFTKYLKYTIDHVGLHIGSGKKFLVDMDSGLEKYSFKETSKYIQKELGPKEYKELINKVNIKDALPANTKENEIFSLLARMHSKSINEKILNPNINEQEL